MAQAVVDTFGDAGSAIAFLADSMLPGPQEGAVHTVIIRIDPLSAPAGGQRVPETLESCQASVAQSKADNLTGVARTGNPQPQVSFLGDAKFVNLQRIEREPK